MGIPPEIGDYVEIWENGNYFSTVAIDNKAKYLAPIIKVTKTKGGEGYHEYVIRFSLENTPFIELTSAFKYNKAYELGVSSDSRISIIKSKSQVCKYCL